MGAKNGLLGTSRSIPGEASYGGRTTPPRNGRASSRLGSGVAGYFQEGGSSSPLQPIPNFKESLCSRTRHFH